MRMIKKHIQQDVLELLDGLAPIPIQTLIRRMSNPIRLDWGEAKTLLQWSLAGLPPPHNPFWRLMTGSSQESRGKVTPIDPSNMLAAACSLLQGQ